MKYTLTLIIICWSCFANARNGDPIKSVVPQKISSQIIIDGELNESVWSDLQPSGNFWQYFPSDSSLAKNQTEFYLVYDDKNIYIGIRCYSSGSKWLTRDLKRDYRAFGSDNITFVFDTFDDQTNGIFFGINPEGVIREGVITNGGNGFRDFSSSWDNKWRGEAKKFDGYYTAELEIPFSTLRYDSENDKWGLLVYRFDTQDNESSVWTHIPRNQTLFSMAYTGNIIWDNGLPTPSRTVSLIPYIIAGANKNFEDGTPANKLFDIGGDAKIAITSGLNLDLTANPNFAQVEVDRQITDLSRFEIFFPERRQFFLENADLFGQFGFSDINPFFSRRIGVGFDVNTSSVVQNRILGGLRLSGKINQDTRIGLLNMQTANENSKGLPGTNYTVAVIQRKIFTRSNIGIIAVNKQITGPDPENTGNRFNRLIGTDFNYSSGDNTWSGKTFFHYSFGPEKSGNSLAHGAELEYSKRKFGVAWSHAYVGEDFNAEVGFIRRKNYFRISPEAELRFYPQNDFINDFAPGIETEILWQPGFGRTDQRIRLRIDGVLNNSSRFGLGISHNYVYLFRDFDPTGTGSTPLPEGTAYNYVNFDGFVFGDQRKTFSYFIRPSIGSYFNGFRAGISGSFTIRYRPKGSVSLNYSYNYFSMPHIESTKQTILVGPRIDYTFSKALFFTTLIQYNSQTKNTNINARLQWRFAPVSDFFLVFTDNYFTGNIDDQFSFSVKNRAIVAKFTYWINT